MSYHSAKRLFFIVLSSLLIVPYPLLTPKIAHADPQSVITAFISANGGSSVYFQEVGNTSSVVNPGATTSTPPASLYKLFVAQFMFQRASTGNLSLTSTVNITSFATTVNFEENGLDDIPDTQQLPWGRGSTVTNSTPTYRACMEAMLIYSDNVCGSALASWADGLNIDAYLTSQGYTGTSLDNTDRSTARDVATLMLKIAGGTFVNQSASTDIYGILQRQFHKSKIPAGVPSATEVANKTGDLHGSNYSHDAAIIKINGKTYVLVVMTRLDPESSTTAPTIAKLAADIFGDTATTGATTTGSGECVNQEYSVAGNVDIYKTLQWPLYDSESKVSCVSTCSATPTTPGGGFNETIEEREQNVYNYFSQMTIGGQKLNLIQIAGAMGNLKHESGYSPIAENDDGYYGLAQWDPTGRLVSLKAFSDSKGLNFQTLNAQLQYMQEELTNPNLRFNASSWIPLLSATTIEQATQIWQDYYEGARGQGDAQRLTYAREIYAKFSGTPPVTNTGSTASADCSANGGLVNTEGYHYPVGPLRQAGDTPENIHDEPKFAYDFMRAGGTPVYAVYSGTIVAPSSEEFYKGVTGCYRINLTTDDGWKYWYGHLQNISVKDGDRVVAGQKIAEVADNSLGPVCHGRAPTAAPGSHLHLDRGFPKGVGGGGTCEGGGDGCRNDPTFIEFLQKLYMELPA